MTGEGPARQSGITPTGIVFTANTKESAAQAARIIRPLTCSDSEAPSL
jgi:hypothetical protein